MRIGVVGAGAIGAYVGALLARAGSDVALLARGAHCQTMQANGVRVVSETEDFTVRVPVTDNPHDIGEVDVVFLGLKAHQYASAGALLRPLLGEKTSVVAAQNGVPWWYFHGHGGPYDGRRIESVDPGGVVSAVISPERAIGCVVYCSSELAEPGVVRHIEGRRFPLGEPDGGESERTTAFCAALRAAGLKSAVTSRIRPHIWTKLLGNAVFNPLSALTEATLEDICRHPETRSVAATMMAEVLAVAQALDADPMVSIDKRIEGAESVGQHRTSMLQDLDAGKELELAALVTAVLELGELTAVSTPVLRTVHAAVDLLAIERQRRGELCSS